MYNSGKAVNAWIERAGGTGSLYCPKKNKKSSINLLYFRIYPEYDINTNVEKINS